MKDPADMKKYQPYLLPMNSEESQRYYGIRQALLGKGPGFEDTQGLGQHYGVVFPELPPQLPKEKPVVAPPDPQVAMPDDGVTADPNDGGMATGLALPNMMPAQGMQPNAMQNPMQKRGLGRLMAGLAARTGGF